MSVHSGTRSDSALASRIDHTLLDAAAAAPEIERLCAEALELSFATVCVNPIWVPRCAARLDRSPVIVCSVVGFPLGAHLTEVKALEARRAVEQGARELDVVGLIGALVAGDVGAFELDLAAVIAAAGPAPVKAILEVGRLTREQKIAGARAAMGVGAAFVKTSTGASGGATVEDVRLLRETVGPDAGVKASGGIRSYAQARAMLEAGASRLGTSSGVMILREAAAS